MWTYAFLFSIPILKHHSGYLSKDYSYETDKIKSIHHLVEILGYDIPFEFSNSFFIQENRLWEYFDSKTKDFDFFPLFALLKLNYSLLTASDYLATSNYMNNIKLKTKEDFGIISDELKEKLIHNFDNNSLTPWNADLISDPNKYLTKPLSELIDKSNTNLNFIRQKMGSEVLCNVETQKDENIFYIEAPTGGGKTNMSMIAIRKMLELHPEINKVFYVFPFTTLITQTAKSIKEAFGLSDHEIAQIHSKSGFQEKEYTHLNEVDAKYGKEKRSQIDNMFVNYPFALLTHITFFDILKSNKKDTNYLLHRLANSIVIIDELQAYNPEHWDKIKYFINKYADLFNIRFIIMSATLPKIDNIELSDYKPKAFISLIENAKDYLQNPNFSQRVKINTDLLNKKVELQELANFIFEKSRAFAVSRTDKFTGSVYTIIEFIFKKSASEFYSEIIKYETNNGMFFDEIFVLSGTIIEPRRKYIIQFLKNPINRKKKILLITTQVVEAGVDIDMDLGFKQQSLIDSDEQLAGRINRNINKQNCELYLFKQKGVTPKSIYGKDLRYEVTSKQLNPTEIKKILTEKDFKLLYDRVFEEIEKTNKSAYKKGINEYLSNFKNFNYKDIHQQFKLIESDNTNVFVPIDIPIIGYSSENNFSKNEIKFINENNCKVKEEVVSGEKIWELYISFTENPLNRFSIEAKILNGIMSKFTFSIFAKKINSLFRFLENPPTIEENQFQQYFKIRKDELDKLYSYEAGINETYLKEQFNLSYDFI